MKLLVTGVAGFIGSNFVEYILTKSKDVTIIGLDALTYSGKYENIKRMRNQTMERFFFVNANINNKELVEYIFTEFEIDGVINFAAESHVDNSIRNPGIFFETNILGVANLLEVAKKFWYKDGKWDTNKKFLQISTDEVYGSLGDKGLFSETTPLDPHSPYSSSKASADLIALSYYYTYGMPILITRCSNNYGPKQLIEKLIPMIISNALSISNIPIFGDGNQIRDWLHVYDHCSAIDLVYRKGVFGQVYNIGGNNEIKNIDLTKLIINHIHEHTSNPSINEGLIVHVDDRLGHDQRYGINTNKIQRELGWNPKIPFSEGIKSTIEWYLNNK